MNIRPSLLTLAALATFSSVPFNAGNTQARNQLMKKLGYTAGALSAAAGAYLIYRSLTATDSQRAASSNTHQDNSADQDSLNGEAIGSLGDIFKLNEDHTITDAHGKVVDFIKLSPLATHNASAHVALNDALVQALNHPHSIVFVQTNGDEGMLRAGEIVSTNNKEDDYLAEVAVDFGDSQATLHKLETIWIAYEFRSSDNRWLTYNRPDQRYNKTNLVSLYGPDWKTLLIDERVAFQLGLLQYVPSTLPRTTAPYTSSEHKVGQVGDVFTRNEDNSIATANGTQVDLIRVSPLLRVFDSYSSRWIYNEIARNITQQPNSIVFAEEMGSENRSLLKLGKIVGANPRDSQFPLIDFGDTTNYPAPVNPRKIWVAHSYASKDDATARPMSLTPKIFPTGNMSFYNVLCPSSRDRKAVVIEPQVLVDLNNQRKH